MKQTVKKEKTYKKNWPMKNLGELLNFLDRMHPDGLSLNALSRKMGITPGAVSNLFMRDDMKLSKAESIVRSYGYELKLFFPVRTYAEGITPPNYAKDFDSAGNLKGLAKYIYDSNWSINYVATLMHMYPKMLSSAIKKGDILLSKLNMVTDALGICYFWRYVKIENKDTTNNNK
ncbi:MAG: hypothetical protein IJ584_02830 [Bacteroidales bacterium]|nr:hypothetical protein [Bacteroidales bacterium]